MRLMPSGSLITTFQFHPLLSSLWDVQCSFPWNELLNVALHNTQDIATSYISLLLYTCTCWPPTIRGCHKEQRTQERWRWPIKKQNNENSENCGSCLAVPQQSVSTWTAMDLMCSAMLQQYIYRYLLQLVVGEVSIIAGSSWGSIWKRASLQYLGPRELVSSIWES